jgi:hypothetical protein
MIKTPVSAKLECLEMNSIMHDLFIAETYRELHLWQPDKLQETLIVLKSREIEFNSIVSQGEGEDLFYIIKF